MAERPWKFESSRPHHLIPCAGIAHHRPMAGASSEAIAAPERKLGFWMCLALVVGNMIGSGIFLLPASLAPLRLERDLWLGRRPSAARSASPSSSPAGPRHAGRCGPYDLSARRVRRAGPASSWRGATGSRPGSTNATLSVAAVCYLSLSCAGAWPRPGVAPPAAIGFVCLFTADQLPRRPGGRRRPGR